jgi:hypothetical protein
MRESLPAKYIILTKHRIRRVESSYGDMLPKRLATPRDPAGASHSSETGLRNQIWNYEYNDEATPA